MYVNKRKFRYTFNLVTLSFTLQCINDFMIWYMFTDLAE